MIIGRRNQGVGAYAVAAQAAGRDLALQIGKGLLYAAVILAPGLIHLQALVLGPAQVIFRVVQEKNVHALKAQPLQAAAQLVVQKLRMDAVLQARGVFHQICKRLSLGLALPAQLIVSPLEIPGLGDHHHLLALQDALSQQIGQDLARQGLAAPVGVI